jgi:hypothetical protein
MQEKPRCVICSLSRETASNALISCDGGCKMGLSIVETLCSLAAIVVVYHQRCLKPRLIRKPSGPFLCPFCLHDGEQLEPASTTVPVVATPVDSAALEGWRQESPPAGACGVVIVDGARCGVFSISQRRRAPVKGFVYRCRVKTVTGEQWGWFDFDDFCDFGRQAVTKRWQHAAVEHFRPRSALEVDVVVSGDWLRTSEAQTRPQAQEAAQFVSSCSGS